LCLKCSTFLSEDGITVEEIDAEDDEDNTVLGITEEDASGQTKQYETVTIVPSEGDSGEVSYVLIMQQPEEKEEKEDDLKVFDFDEGEGENSQVNFLIIWSYCDAI